MVPAKFSVVRAMIDGLNFHSFSTLIYYLKYAVGRVGGLHSLLPITVR